MYELNVESGPLHLLLRCMVVVAYMRHVELLVCNCAKGNFSCPASLSPAS